jgi:hypothetical protein
MIDRICQSATPPSKQPLRVGKNKSSLPVPQVSAKPVRVCASSPHTSSRSFVSSEKQQTSGGIIPCRFVRFASIHPFIGFAERADAAFHALNEPKCQALLTLARVIADKAFKTSLGHGAVSFRDGVHGHSIRLSFAPSSGVMGLVGQIRQTAARRGADRTRNLTRLADSTPKQGGRVSIGAGNSMVLQQNSYFCHRGPRSRQGRAEAALPHWDLNLRQL